MEISPINTRQAALLAFKGDGKRAVVKHRTAQAVIQVVGSEIWIPSVNRVEKGDFKALMDALVEELDGHNRFRFVAVYDESPSDIFPEMAPDDARHIKEAVNGFEEEIVETDDGEAPTLVGNWTLED